MPWAAVGRGRKLHPIRKPRSGEGAEGDRFTCSTEEAGPEKPGNRVEEKTLRTGRTREWKGIRLRTRRLRRHHTSDPRTGSSQEAEPGCRTFVGAIGEGVDER